MFVLPTTQCLDHILPVGRADVSASTWLSNETEIGKLDARVLFTLAAYLRHDLDTFRPAVFNAVVSQSIARMCSIDHLDAPTSERSANGIAS